MIRRVELTGDITYDSTGNPISVNGVSLAHRQVNGATKTAIKDKLIQLIEEQIDESAILTKGRVDDILFVRGADNDYTIAVVAKKDCMEPRKGALSDNPIVKAIDDRVVDCVTSLKDYKVVQTHGNIVRINTKVGDFEVKVTKKKERL